MKIGKVLLILLGLVVVAALVGFGYFAVVDIPVKQTEVSKEIPHDRFTE